ncbi:MAG TPA: hypothetical protein VFL59_06940 [Candidatus Nanopelagicales bacterium]|nr:hypothetical protein [Candidatus Nanopelagicales bacterium]
MSLVQGIQTKQYALEQRQPAGDDATRHRARLTVAAMADRHGGGVEAAREVLDALGLLDPPAALQAASS